MRPAIAPLVVLLTAACAAPVTSNAGASPTATASLSATPSPLATVTLAPPTSTTAVTARPAPTPIVALTQLFQPSATGWRPTGPTLMFADIENGTSTLTAVSLPSGGAAASTTRLLTFAASSWDLRDDGGAIAVAVAGAPAARIALWDIAAGTGTWLTPEPAGVPVGSPIWSADRSSLFYATYTSIQSATIVRIAADGRGDGAVVATLDRFGDLVGRTPDGRGLIWSRGQEGGSADIVDIATGANRHLADVARVVSWRTKQPRILLGVGGCCAGRPGGSLVAFDDVAMTATTVAERGPAGDPAWGTGSWDPSGTRIAATRFDQASPYEASLVILDPAAGTTRSVPGTQGAGFVLWLPEGIVYSVSSTRGSATEIFLLPEGGGAPVSLYRGVSVGRPVLVRP